MKQNNIPPKRSYEATLTRPDRIPLIKRVKAIDRRKAVYLVEQWFWKVYKGTVGPVNRAIVVSDPYHEVRYGPDFKCGDRKFKLLPQNVIDRLIAESSGELMPETRNSPRHRQKNSVRRVKRRRDFGVFIAPCIRLLKSGAMHYRIITSPQNSRNGRRYRKRKYRDVRLNARTLPDAIKEIVDRKLDREHQKKTGRQCKVRDIVFTSYVAGLIDLDSSERSRFSKVISKYDEPRTRSLVPAL